MSQGRLSSGHASVKATMTTGANAKPMLPPALNPPFEPFVLAFASRCGTTRNNVDQIKSRMTAELKELAMRLADEQ